MSYGDFPIDPAVVHQKRGGLPPEGHERRCQSKARGSQIQCKNWSAVGANYCRFHGGKHQSGRSRKLKKSRYSHVIGGTLAERLNDLANQSEEDRLDLSGEVDLGEAALEKALIIFDLVCQQGKADKKDDTTGDVTPNYKARQQAADALKSAIDFQRTLRIDHAKIQLMSKEKISANNINWYVAQIHNIFSDVMNEFFAGQPAEALKAAESFAQRVKEIKSLNQGDGLPNVVIKIE